MKAWLVHRLGWTLAVATCLLTPVGLSQAQANPVLRVRVEPPRPTLLDEVTVVARVTLEFGEEVRFEMGAPNPALWRALSESVPMVTQRWRHGRVEHVAVWRLLPLLPGAAELPEVSATRGAVAVEPPDWQVTGKTVQVAAPPGAETVGTKDLLDVVAELPATSGARTRMLALALILVAVLLLWFWQAHRRRAGDADCTSERELRGLLEELEQLRLYHALPARDQVVRWRRLLPRLGIGPLPEGLLTQADGLLYQADGFDPEMARTWAGDLRQWLLLAESQKPSTLP